MKQSIDHMLLLQAFWLLFGLVSYTILSYTSDRLRRVGQDALILLTQITLKYNNNNINIAKLIQPITGRKIFRTCHNRL